MATREQTLSMVARARDLARQHLDLATQTAAYLREWTAGGYLNAVNDPLLSLDDIAAGIQRADVVNAVTTFTHMNNQVANGHDTNLTKAARPQ